MSYLKLKEQTKIVQDYNQKVNLLLNNNRSKVALAVSGGSDSTALAKLSLEIDLDCIALIVNHNLRPESGDESVRVKDYLEKRGVRSNILNWHFSQKPTRNIHHQARMNRYNLLTEYCRKHNIHYLFTGHNYNDQAETLILRIIRGTGIYGLSGIFSHSIINDIKVCRPLLQYSNKMLKQFLMDGQWSWIEDPSNQLYKRGALRTQLMQCDDYELIIDRLNLLNYNASRTRNYLEQQTQIAFNNCIIMSNKILIPLSLIQNLHDEIALLLLRKIIMLIGKLPENKLPRLINLENLLHNIQSIYDNNILEKWNGHATLGYCKILYRNQMLEFMPEITRIKSFS